MGRTKRIKDFLRKQPPFVAMTWKLLHSQAYKKLKPSSAKALPYFLGQVYLTYDNPDRYIYDFDFSYSEAKKYSFSSSTFSSIIKQLVEVGFIDPVDKGGLRGNGKSYNYFKLSKRWEAYGTDNFERMNWTCFIPKPRLKFTSNCEMYSFKKRNRQSIEAVVISQNEVVDTNSR